MLKTRNLKEMACVDSAKKPIPIVLALGFLGGATLILTTFLTSKGLAIFVAYTALFITTVAVLRAVDWSSFSKRFTTSFLIFMVATIVLYLFIGIFDAGTILEIPVQGHLWRLGLIAVIGSVLSLSVAYLANIG